MRTYPREWAVNDVYVSGVVPGTPTKVAVPNADADDGNRPGEQPAAQYANFVQNEASKWIRSLSDAPILNSHPSVWPARVSPYGVTDVALLDVSRVRTDGTAEIFYSQTH